jgi:hypothetical protein
MMSADEELALRRRINENLTNIRSGKYRRERDARAKEKRTELEKAFAWEIQLGAVVLEYRELLKLENRYARKKTLTDEDRGHWEEIDARLDTLREELKDYGRDELTRFVRLYNKSMKVRYKL